MNIAYRMDIVQHTTVNTVITFHAEMAMVIVIQELVRQVLFVEKIISWNTIHFSLIVPVEKQKMPKFASKKVYYLI